MPVPIPQARAPGRQNPQRSAHPAPRCSAHPRSPAAHTYTTPSPARREAPGTPCARQRPPPHPRRQAPHRELRRRLWIHPGDMPGNLRARATSKNGSTGVFRAPSESVMSARARAERPVSLRQPRLRHMQHMLRHELAGPRGGPSPLLKQQQILRRDRCRFRIAGQRI